MPSLRTQNNRRYADEQYARAKVERERYGHVDVFGFVKGGRAMRIWSHKLDTYKFYEHKIRYNI